MTLKPFFFAFFFTFP
ncbi:pheA operon leader peptide PheL [Leclercia tamurae]|uniref:PheA operon leader peptide PheL n=1 Tax=Leclercia tamurae TaxID=2926467 RepID=A0ABT2R6P7_9ENTR|nr:pheA operon leader peptide PheL [Leclercia tamurae]MCU6676539.1 pheA operon leader peptide PheL [Leclercia tamurae]